MRLGSTKKLIVPFWAKEKKLTIMLTCFKNASNTFEKKLALIPPF